MSQPETAVSLWRIADELMAIDRELEENGGELTPELESRIADWEEAMPAKVAGIAHYCRYQSAIASACKAEEERIRAIRKSAEKREERMRAYLSACMAGAGMNSLKPAPGTTRAGSRTTWSRSWRSASRRPTPSRSFSISGWTSRGATSTGAPDSW